MHIKHRKSISRNNGDSDEASDKEYWDVSNCDLIKNGNDSSNDMKRSEKESTRSPFDDEEDVGSSDLFLSINKSKSLKKKDDGDNSFNEVYNDDEYTDELTEDVYSMILTSSLRSSTFLFSFLVFIFQASLIGLIMYDLLGHGTPDNPLNVPPRVDDVVTVAQAFAMLLAVAYQDDVITALIMFHRGYKLFDSVDMRLGIRHGEGGPSINFKPVHSCCVRWFIASVLQFTVGCGLMMIIFILIMQSDSIIGMMLNFAALMFVSEIDDVAFFMAKRGFVTNKLQKETINVANYKFPNPRRKSSNIIRRLHEWVSNEQLLSIGKSYNSRILTN